jgi:hypothetical protein
MRTLWSHSNIGANSPSSGSWKGTRPKRSPSSSASPPDCLVLARLVPRPGLGGALGSLRTGPPAQADHHSGEIVLRWWRDSPTEQGFATEWWSAPRLAQLRFTSQKPQREYCQILTGRQKEPDERRRCLVSWPIDAAIAPCLPGGIWGCLGRVSTLDGLVGFGKPKIAVGPLNR